jgi:hypothetical protein
MEQALAKERGVEPNPVDRLIAIMLGRLEMDVGDCISTSTNLMKAVFEKSSWLPVGWMGKTNAQFDSKRLKSAIEGGGAQ